MKIKILLAIIVAIAASCTRIEKHTVECKVYSIEKIVKTEGDKDHFYTAIHWLVTTDHGTFAIETSGLFPCPEAVGKIKPDSCYRLTVDGWFESSFLGVYPNIIKVEHLNK